MILGEERIPCYMETVQLSSSFFCQNVGRKVGFCLIPTFCPCFFAPKVGRKLYMMRPVKTESPSDFSRLKSRTSSRASENCCGGRLFRVHSTLPVGSVQLRVQHFGAEKLDNELNIKWERTFLMTCSKTGDVFLRQRLYCLMLVYRQADTG